MKAAIRAERAGIISKLEVERGTKIITLIHRRELWEDKDEGKSALNIQNMF
ncbi:MAG: hypothetical protein WA130_00595 [Candidatus Methanoperedens sp.]